MEETTEQQEQVADYDFGKKLRDETCACRYHQSRFGVSKAVSKSQKQQAADTFGADSGAVSMSKKLLDTKDPAYKGVTDCLHRMKMYWISTTVPYPDRGIRLIRRGFIEEFETKMKEFQSQLEEAVDVLEGQYERMLEARKESMGELFNIRDYPDSIKPEFEVSWDFTSVEPPDYLKQLNPELYKREQEKVAKRLEQAVEMAESGFVNEFKKFVASLYDKLAGGDDGKRKVIRDSAVNNIHDFIAKFKSLNIGSNQELEGLVNQCEDLVDGVTPEELRKSNELKDILADGLGKIDKQIDEMIVDKPTRSIQLEDFE